MENIREKLWEFLKDDKDLTMIKINNDTGMEVRKKVFSNIFMRIIDQIRNQIISSVQDQIKKEL
jgi:hypothetical protein